MSSWVREYESRTGSDFHDEPDDPEVAFDHGRVLVDEGNILYALCWLKFASKKGHAGAMYLIGNLLYQGSGVKKDIKKAMYYYRKSAEGGWRDAMYMVGQTLIKETLEPAFDGEARHWFQKGADLGCRACMYGMGYSDPDPVSMAGWIRRAAEQKLPEAMQAYGLLLDRGLGVEMNGYEGLMWQVRAARAGFKMSMERQTNLCWRICLTSSFHGSDRDEAMQWFRTAAENDKDGSLCWILSRHLRPLWDDTGANAEDRRREVVDLLEKSAVRGWDQAIFELGRMYATGDESVAQDEARTVQIYRRAADEHANANAACMLGKYFESGGFGGVEKDIPTAIMWYNCALRWSQSSFLTEEVRERLTNHSVDPDAPHLS